MPGNMLYSTSAALMLRLRICRVCWEVIYLRGLYHRLTNMANLWLNDVYVCIRQKNMIILCYLYFIENRKNLLFIYFLN